MVGHLLEAAAVHAGAAPRAVTAHLLGGVASDVPARVVTTSDRQGRTGSVRSEMWQDGGLRAVAQVLTLARPASPVDEPYPPVGGYRPEDGVPFELPRDYVPIAEHTEIRALGPSRPLAGGPEPRLHAWVRMRGGLAPLVQLGVLLDALPPSLFAVRDRAGGHADGGAHRTPGRAAAARRAPGCAWTSGRPGPTTTSRWTRSSCARSTGPWWPGAGRPGGCPPGDGRAQPAQ